MKKPLRQKLTDTKLPPSTTLQGLDTNNRQHPVQAWVVGRNKRYAVSRLFQIDAVLHQSPAGDLFTVIHVASGCCLDKWSVFDSFIMAKDAAEHADQEFGLHDFYQDEADDMEWKVSEEAITTLRDWAKWARPRTIYPSLPVTERISSDE